MISSRKRENIGFLAFTRRMASWNRPYWESLASPLKPSSCFLFYLGEEKWRQTPYLSESSSLRRALWRILQAACFVAILFLLVTKGPLIDRLEHEDPTLGCLAVWAVGIFSYRQDARHHDPWWAFLSQIADSCRRFLDGPCCTRVHPQIVA